MVKILRDDAHKFSRHKSAFKPTRIIRVNDLCQDNDDFGLLLLNFDEN